MAEVAPLNFKIIIAPAEEGKVLIQFAAIRTDGSFVVENGMVQSLKVDHISMTPESALAFAEGIEQAAKEAKHGVVAPPSIFIPPRIR